jgi:hypothetical protein
LPRQQRITAIEIDPTRAAHLAMMPHCRLGAMSVSQMNFLDHVGKGPGYFGTFFNTILMTPLRRQNDDLRHVQLFRRWFATVQARQEELQEETFTESAPPMQSRLIWAVKESLTQ